MFETENEQKKLRVESSLVENIAYSVFIFNSIEEELLSLIEAYYPHSPLWKTQPLLKVAALIDIYDGCFPAIYPRNEVLGLLKAQQLVTYCRSACQLLPRTRYDKDVFGDYRKECAEQNKIFAVQVKQLFFNTEQVMKISDSKYSLYPQKASKKNL